MSFCCLCDLLFEPREALVVAANDRAAGTVGEADTINASIWKALGTIDGQEIVSENYASLEKFFIRRFFRPSPMSLLENGIIY